MSQPGKCGVGRSSRAQGRWVVALLVLPLAVVIWARGLAGGELPLEPTSEDRQIAKGITVLLRMAHLTGQPLDDEISRRCINLFVESLDPMKVYFRQPDIAKIYRHETDLDDWIGKGDIRFAYETFRTFLKRIEECVELVDELLPLEHEFSLDEMFVVEPDLRTYAANLDESRERWRKRIKYDLLDQKADGVEGEEARKKIARRYHSFATRMQQTDRDRLLELYLGALTTAFDPHTVYWSPKTLENFEISMRLELEGIGAALRWVDGYTTVSTILPGGAADKDGRLKPQDRIVSVAQGDDDEWVDVVDMVLSDVVPMIRGKQGTVVRLKVAPAGETEKKVYRLVRARVELKDSEAIAEVFEEGRKPDGKPYKIGVIDLPSFYRDMEGAQRGKRNFRSTTRDVSKILDDFNAKGVDAVVLDLRRNGGGSLTEAINLTGLFIDQGPIVQVKDPAGKVRPYPDEIPGRAWEGPLVVLTSKLSASASEILAGAIQDYGRGLVVGDKTTHGKGTVQTLLDLGEHLGDSLYANNGSPKWGALKITTQQFYRPNGASTQNRGVLADVEIPSLTTHLDVGEADLDYSVDFDRIPPAGFQKEAQITLQMLTELRRRSQDRVSKSEEFGKVFKRIARYQERKDRTAVTLNDKAFLAERAELKKDATPEAEDSDLPEKGVVRTFYLDEALAISLDYIQLSNPTSTVVH